MATNKPVVLYGAGGYSGRLAAEYLREYNVPFVAAGRNKTKMQEVMNRVPGIETAQYEIVETGGSVAELAKLFAGAKVVCNTVGPFIYYGPPVVEACFEAGCHYLDIAGEQAWHRQLEEKWSSRFADKRLVIVAGMAFMSAPSDAAARLALETGGIDSLEILTMFDGMPTFGSTQTIFAVIQTDGYYLDQNHYKPWQRAVGYEAVVPGYIRTQLALSWGGFPHPVWYKNHPQVANVKSFGGLLNRQIMENVLATEKQYESVIRPLPKAEQERKLQDMANAVQTGTPPRENSREQRTIDVISGRGSLASAQVVQLGTCCYQQTGLMQAFGAHSLIHTPPTKTGYASPAEAFGHREILRTLEAHGLSKTKIYP
ncbi:MAG TPA: DUF5938 domain-containing protein [Candidatus Acidoferrales bacterium]|nr:DUF5938 domain-containing protein [Candidatus Acidoferrales bacterium]